MSAEDFGRVLGRLFRDMFGMRGNNASTTVPVTPEQYPSTGTRPVLTYKPETLGTEVESEWRLPPIPPGFQIYESRIEIAGLHYRRDDALRFIRSNLEHSLAFEPDPDNKHDKNAIKVIGVTGASRYHLGFVPASTSKQIVNAGLTDLVQARLERVYAGSNDYVSVIFQIIGPKTHRQVFRDTM